jgi:hypothetical protein
VEKVSHLFKGSIKIETKSLFLEMLKKEDRPAIGCIAFLEMLIHRHWIYCTCKCSPTV